MKRAFCKLFGALALTAAVGCGGPDSPAASPSATLGSVREDAQGSRDGEALGRWALFEMLAPGGTADGARRARAKLGDDGPGLLANMARGLDGELHGDPRGAARAYAAALDAARTSRDPDAPLAAWFAANHLVGLRGSMPGLYKAHEAAVRRVLASPGNVGWRAYAELAEWSVAEAYDRAEVTGDAYDELVRGAVGCVKGVRVAGPFGSGTSRDRKKSFAAERAPWPVTWPEEPKRGTTPRVLKTEQNRCLVAATERSEGGIYYAETFFTTDRPRDLVVAAHASIALWVDDVLVVERDIAQWGGWHRYGGAVRVGAGRHRVVAKLLDDSTVVRVLEPDGRPARLPTDADPRLPYGMSTTEPLPSPNVLLTAVTNERALSPVTRALAAQAAHAEGMNDVASWLMEPLTAAPNAAPVALALSAVYSAKDPIYAEESRRKNERELHTRATTADPRLWYSRAWLTLDEADQRGFVEAVEPLRKLAAEFPSVYEIPEQLGRVYGRLGWRGERLRTFEDLANRFPDNTEVLAGYLAALEQDGAAAIADKVAARIHKLDPDTEIELDRAIARRDWPAAIAELRRLQKRRPDRKEIAGKIADVLLRSGDPKAAFAEIEKALAKNPADGAARFRLADMAYARGDAGALRRALAETIHAGGKGKDLREAVELLEGATFLEPYRMDSKKVIAEFKAWEASGKKMEGTAARVLDYAATWIHPDGSSEMLEHEILKIQSQEAINKEAEQKPPEGLVLRLRVIKPDGSVLEPEAVQGKPTLTMPHLEVGDYIEMEHITAQGGDARGRRYKGPVWYFREADKGYWRSEFVAITPKDRDVEVETRGAVPAPKVSAKGLFVERRWRVDESPPAPEEPSAPPPTEFLPSVRVGWGGGLAEMLERLVDSTSDDTPLDPRLGKKAAEIAGAIPAAKRDERARAAYKYVTEHIEDGDETDGRRVLTSKSGSRQAAFYHLVRQLGVPVSFALVKNKLAMPPVGKMTEVEAWDSALLTLEIEGNGRRFLSVRDKFAPYGYVPAEMRGQPAHLLVPGAPATVVPAAGAADALVITGRIDVHEDGSAKAAISQSYSGKLGIGMRNVLDKVAGGQRDELIESRLLARNLPGARLRGVKVLNQTDTMLPLVLDIDADVSQLLRPQGDKVTLRSIFPMHLAQLATLAERQTPLLLGSASHFEVHLQVVFPQSFRMPADLPRGEIKDGDRLVSVRDTVEGHAIHFDRVIDIPAGRVLPGKPYAAFVKFVQDADQLAERDVLLGR